MALLTVAWAAMASPFRADHVGSLLRPPELLQARTEFNEGRITAEQLHAAEDAAVLQALDVQQQAGIGIFTEGEYRRSGWSSAVAESVEGLVEVEDHPMGRILGPWQGPSADIANASLTIMRRRVAGARLRQTRRLAGREAEFLRQHAPGPWKIT